MIADIFIVIINLLLSLVIGIINWIISVLPASPFTGIDLAFPSNLVGYINWIFPFTEVITILTAWGAVVGIFLFIRMIMKVLHVQ